MTCLMLLAAALVDRPLITAAEFHSGRYDNQQVMLEATVVDAFMDETNPDYIFFVLKNSNEFLYSYIMKRFLVHTPEQLVGAEISAWGVIFSPVKSAHHHYAQRIFDICSTNAFTVTRPAPDPFTSPDISTAEKCRPEELTLLGRRTAHGLVLAVWNSGRSVLIDNEGKPLRADLATHPPPDVGIVIDVAGFPETDLKELNLSRAVWRPSAKAASQKRPDVLPIRIKDMFTDRLGRQTLNRDFHGVRVRFTGIVQGDLVKEQNNRFVCGDESCNVSVDISALKGTPPDIRPSDRIEVTGTALYDVDNVRPNAAFPLVRGYIIAPGSMQDITVITHARNLIPVFVWYAFGGLAAILIGIMSWNRALKRLASKRGIALAREEIARAEAELRTVERTRLAVELHDSIAQSLTGIALEIQAAQRMDDSDSLRTHLRQAGQQLDSCRTELRYCLWDLHSEALEKKDLGEAIRLTLVPYVKDVKVSIRFNVDRALLSDSTAHALLCIIRELVINAIRHGCATQVQIAGLIENGRLLVSVQDNGCGFVADLAPGTTEGHFGLEGIRERIGRLAGDFTIESKPGDGTRATIALSVKSKENRNE